MWSFVAWGFILMCIAVGLTYVSDYVLRDYRWKEIGKQQADRALRAELRRHVK